MKPTHVAIIIAIITIAGALFFASAKNSAPVSIDEAKNQNNVHMEGETQIIEIDAKGGYLPRKSIAKAGVPTLIRFNTQATFDCSSSVRIPRLDVSQILPQTGSTDIDVGVQKVGPLEGTCGMGMYPFEVMFE